MVASIDGNCAPAQWIPITYCKSECEDRNMRAGVWLAYDIASSRDVKLERSLNTCFLVGYLLILLSRSFTVSQYLW